MTTTGDTPHKLLYAGSSRLPRYGWPVSNVEEPIRRAKAGQRTQAAGDKMAAEGIEQRNAAIVDMSNAGMSPTAIARELTHDEFKFSATNVRLILKMHRARSSSKDGSDA